MIESRKQFLKDAEKMGFDATDRCTGKSTAICLKIISDAMLDPGKPQKIWDNYGTSNTKQSRMADENNMRTIDGILKDLGLKGFTFNRSRLTITYDLNW